MTKRFKLLLLLGTCCFGWAESPKPLNPQIQAIVSQISSDHIAETQQKLETFQTRNIFSATDDPVHGVGAAREWIAAQFKSYNPKLEVSFDKHRLAKQGRAFSNVEIWNVVAVLKGTSQPQEQVLVSGHYDTINLTYKQNEKGQRELDGPGTAAAIAPGVTDDGSGTAAVLELARVLSQYQFRKTIVFIAGCLAAVCMRKTPPPAMITLKRSSTTTSSVATSPATVRPATATSMSFPKTPTILHRGKSRAT